MLTRRRPRPGRRRDASDDAAARHVDAGAGARPAVAAHDLHGSRDVGRRCVLSGVAGGIFPSGEGLKKKHLPAVLQIWRFLRERFRFGSG